MTSPQIARAVITQPRSVSFTVPLVPPNLNHYKVPIWKQRRFAVTAPAAAFKNAVAIFSQGANVMAKYFIVEATVYLGRKQKGDVDGFGKLILDALADACVFRDLDGKSMSDAHVYDLHLRKRRDEDNPRTEITVRALTEIKRG